ncbi:MAG: hypothetical protein C0593_05735 [Marinilabiliales bacterium]|nr:MAG: hypothetical protein C0593_05735 [Marinilabiliales bacterium]
MKKALILFSILLGIGIVSAQAQEVEYDNNEIRTLAGNKNISNGFYAGLNFGYTPIEDKDAFLTGVRLAWVINHSFALGVTSTGFVTDMDHYNDIADDNFYLTGGYGGIYMEPIFFAKSPIHFSVPITIGAGGIFAWNEDYFNDPWEHGYYEYHDDCDTFFVVEPGLELDMTVVKFMRISLGATYRITDDIQMQNNDDIAVSKDALRNISGYFSLKFGKF